MSTFEQISIYGLGGDRFEISRSDLLLRLCDDWCSHQNFSLTFDFTRLRLGLQIGIFGIIAEGSDFPEIALQNCKSDTTTPLRGLEKLHILRHTKKKFKNFSNFSTASDFQAL
jgi:hypothetical protein